MNLHPLSRESNVKGSLKKYFVDALGSAVTFDTSLAVPDLRMQGESGVKQWYNVDFGEFGREALALYYFDVYCLSRQDAEGVELAKLADVLIDMLVDGTNQDGMRRIPLYDITKTPWEEIGAMVVQDIWDAPSVSMIEDETEIKIFSVRMRWGCQI